MRSNIIAKTVAIVCALALVGMARIARADESAAAQALFDQGRRAMAAHDYATACPRFEESLRLQEGVGTLLNLAVCYEKLGKFASAWSKFLEVAAKAQAEGQLQRAHAGRDRAAALAPKLSHLVIDIPARSRSDGLEIRRDGTAVGEVEWGTAIPVDPGEHTIEASATGKKKWSTTVTVAAGAATEHVAVPELEPYLDAQPPPKESGAPPIARPTLASEPSPSPAAQDTGKGSSGRGSAQRVLAIVAAGVGVAGIGTGSVLGLLSLARHNDANSECPPSACTSPHGVDLWRQAWDLGNGSTVAFAIGGVGVVAGAVLWLTAPRPEDPGTPAVALTLDAGSRVTLRGTW